MVFILQLLNVIYHTDSLADMEKFLHPWNKSHLFVMYDSFNVLLFGLPIFC